MLSNVPRPASAIPDSLRRLGLPDEAWDAVVTSGDVTRTELARRSPGPVHRLGRDTDTALWAGLGLEFTGLSAARFLAMAGLRGPGETPADYETVLRAARARDLELVCANPDVQVPSGGGLLWCAGAVAREYALLGGRVIMAGKPHAPIYQRARDLLDRRARRHVPRSGILALGDGIATDIVGANRMGLDSVFIATGINGDALLSNGHLDVGRAGAALEAAGARATYVMERLA
jgi:HAD superfamily hydrolase (TIGR01459 family)